MSLEFQSNPWYHRTSPPVGAAQADRGTLGETTAVDHSRLPAEGRVPPRELLTSLPLEL
jgi:hypothetical protein